MLIHKKTMGVLHQFWSGRYKKGLDGTAIPLMVEYTFENTGLPPTEWWYVPARSALGRKLLRFYPCCDPVTGEDGTLADVHARMEEQEGLKEPPEKPVRKSRQRRRRKGLLPL